MYPVQLLVSCWEGKLLIIAGALHLCCSSLKQTEKEAAIFNPTSTSFMFLFRGWYGVIGKKDFVLHLCTLKSSEYFHACLLELKISRVKHGL